MSSSVIEQPDINWETYSDHRTPGIWIKQLLERGGDSQFEFNLVKFGGSEFHAPRHRHNFDQIRIGLDGVTKYGTRERLSARTIGYFPEGTWYGPTTVEEPTVQAILQLDGPGRLGYINYIAHDRAVAALKERGEFRDGFYYPNDGGPRVDGYQAGWEEAVGRPMVYPEPRFEFPIYMSIDAFRWLDTPTPGMRRKTLGVFGERGTALEMVSLDRDVSVEIGGDERTVVAFVYSGAVESAQGAVGMWGACLADQPDPLSVRATTDGTEVLLVRFPDFSA